MIQTESVFVITALFYPLRFCGYLVYWGGGQLIHPSTYQSI